jgi:dephospho-CoA kinase
VKVIGITGVFGSGKSTVAGCLKEMGAAVIDADTIVHQIYEPNTEGWRQVTALFGKEILAADGKIDRCKLGKLGFGDQSALKKLNAIVPPLAARQVKTLLELHRRRHDKVVIIEAPLLFEAGWTGMVNEIWVTTAPREVIFRRLNRKAGLSCNEVLARIRRQLPVSEQVKRASQVINTDTTPERLKSKVQRLWQKTTAQ